MNEKIEEQKEEKKVESVEETKEKTKEEIKVEKREKKKIEIPRLIAILLCLVVALCCVGYLGNYFLKIKESEGTIDAIRTKFGLDKDSDDATEEPKMEYVEINGVKVQKRFAKLYTENPDFLGWLTIPDTKVDYPVMQHEGDNEYYINRNFDKEYDGSGLFFMDLYCDASMPGTDNQLIYGHNMRAGTMMAGITKYKDEEFYQKHKEIHFDTIYGDGTYEVIAAFPTEIYAQDDTTHFKYYTFFDVDNAEDFDAYVENCKALTPYEIETDAQYGDKLISLSTCAYHAEEGRFVVVAKLVDYNTFEEGNSAEKTDAETTTEEPDTKEKKN